MGIHKINVLFFMIFWKQGAPIFTSDSSAQIVCTADANSLGCLSALWLTFQKSITYTNSSLCFISFIWKEISFLQSFFSGF